MSIGGSIVSCCCDGPDGTCADIDTTSLPGTANISASWTYTWLTNFYRVDWTWIVDIVPLTGSVCPDNYVPCDNGTQCAKPCAVRSHELVAQHTATLTVNASGTIPKAIDGLGSSYVRLYRGQIDFDYTFTSDYPGTCSDSGTFTAATSSYPSGQATGMLVDLYCDSRAGTWATGMCRPYRSGVSPTEYPEMLLASGPHLRLGFEIPYFDLEDTAPSQSPDCIDPGGDFEWYPRGVGYVGNLGTALPWQKVRPLNLLFVRSAGSAAGAYLMARGAYGGNGVSPNGTESWPSTNHDPYAIPAGDCDFAIGYGSACEADPDRGPTTGGSQFITSCDAFGYDAESGLVSVDCSDLSVPSVSCCQYGAGDRSWGSPPAVDPVTGSPGNCYADSTPGYQNASNILGELTSQTCTVDFT